MVHRYEEWNDGARARKRILWLEEPRAAPNASRVVRRTQHTGTQHLSDNAALLRQSAEPKAGGWLVIRPAEPRRAAAGWLN